ncbi:hypothetical protein LBMAG48_12820 [Phycisphaerae bacterium]|nr:hypothetical protein LBMAG48_12820 [Phycisphaerae bacterium]
MEPIVSCSMRVAPLGNCTGAAGAGGSGDGAAGLDLLTFARGFFAIGGFLSRELRAWRTVFLLLGLLGIRTAV